MNIRLASSATAGSVIPAVKTVGLALLLAGLSACTTTIPPQEPPPPKRTTGERSVEELAKTPDATPIAEPKSKRGNMESYEVFGKRYYVLDSNEDFKQQGIASWYGSKFHGKQTSNGEIYDMYAMSAAHKTLPLPTYLEVENLENGRKIIVRVNDRGPFHDNRIIDLSYTAAIKLGMADKGTALVQIRSINPKSHRGGGAPVETREPAQQQAATPEFYIQVGAFSNIDNAERLKAELSALETPVMVEESALEDGALFRVKLGPLNDVEVADRLVEQLRSFNIQNYLILLE